MTALWAVPAPSGSGRKDTMRRESTNQIDIAYTSLEQEHSIGGGGTRTEMPRVLNEYIYYRGGGGGVFGEGGGGGGPPPRGGGEKE